MLTIITFLIVLGIMIFVHELGHFVVAKFVGVKVLEFSLGLGPRLFGKKWGETDYRICAFPIGGMVKMLGEAPGDTDEKIPPDEIVRSFYNQTPLGRAAITAAGPFLNLILALLLAPMMYIIGIEEPSYPTDPPVVQGITPDSPADKAGFRIGDHILEINGKKFDTWEGVDGFFILNPDATVNVKVKRSEKTLQVSLTLEAHKDYGVGISGFNPYETTVIGVFSEDSAAKAAGLKEGDRIVSIAGKEIRAFSVMKKIIQEAAPGPFVVEAIRDGVKVSANFKPKLVTDRDGGKRYIIGVGPHVPVKLAKYGPVKAFKKGTSFLWEKAIQNFVALGKLVTFQMSFKALSGPVGIGFIVGSARQMGLAYLIQITALISMLLGIINFFPFPALDGGHIMFALMELVSRRKLNRKVLDVLNFAGFAFLMTLIVLVTIQDIYRFREEILKFFGIG